MLTTKEGITAFLKELFPDINVHVFIPGDDLDELVAKIKDAYGDTALAMKIKVLQSAVSQHQIAAMIRIPMGDHALNIMVWDPYKIEREVYSEIYTQAHEAAHPAIDKFLGLDAAIRLAFPDSARFKTAGKDLAVTQKKFDALGKTALSGRMLSGRQLKEFNTLKAEEERLTALIKEGIDKSTFIARQHTLSTLKKMGISISEQDIPAFHERVCDLFACVETARRLENYTAKQLFEMRADATVINALQSRAFSSQTEEMKRSILEHYNADVLDAAAKQPHVFDGLAGYGLLEACITFAGKHYKPTSQIRAELLAAEQKGLMVNSWRKGSIAAGKILLTARRSDPLCALAARFALAQYRECERRAPIFTTSPVRAINTVLKAYYAALMRLGNGN